MIDSNPDPYLSNRNLLTSSLLDKRSGPFHIRVWVPLTPLKEAVFTLSLVPCNFIAHAPLWLNADALCTTTKIWSERITWMRWVNTGWIGTNLTFLMPLHYCSHFRIQIRCNALWFTLSHMYVSPSARSQIYFMQSALIFQGYMRSRVGGNAPETVWLLPKLHKE